MTMSASTGAVAAKRLRDDALEIGVAHDLLDGLALGRGRLDVEQAGGGRVDGDDALVGVDREHALDHAREHGLALVALVRERARSCSSSSSAIWLRLSATAANSSARGT